ncbi:MAG: sigma-54-dependent Fis family transcriptional regulator [Phycisphaerales bacterium]|nr:sigma 54-interacting transcriptional regulator [Phycisphaerae bacterium]NNF43308.1 sigma-54-dependent Fis family transcriptional regulator [Phycisphaerales bacterium]NNM26196.1 sigma-54-dependent Fis family transcriptional regulator [Phycisphaerales bacterium]
MMGHQMISTTEQAFMDAVSRLAYCNPFLPERITHEQAALGPAFVEGGKPWNVHPDRAGVDVNLTRLMERAEPLVAKLGARMREGARPREAERQQYEDLALFVLYYRYLPRFRHPVTDASTDHAGGVASKPRPVAFYRQFVADARAFFDVPGVALPDDRELPHLFACFFQMRRAFDLIFSCIIGVSAPAVRLRAEVWQSIFTHDMRRYRRRLYDRMGDLTTLVTGPSGTGKELVASAIGRARYVAFDPDARRFTADAVGAFRAINLSALSPTLIESELFGHVRGSFTGAVADHVGWLEACPAEGAVFLDEIGDLDGSIQVKLLRVLQTRTFHRIGDTTPRVFEGKIIAATNRDLTAGMQAGRFRNDLYYRLCSDLIRTPSLGERLRDEPGELSDLVAHIIERQLGDTDDTLVDETLTWIDANLGRDYAWPGNIRELEQCVRNILIRGVYRPAGAAAGDTPGGGDDLTRSLACINAANLTADELVRRYCTLVYQQCGSYVETARRLGLDRRTVRARVGND